jgi:hypothetical protein
MKKIVIAMQYDSFDSDLFKTARHCLETTKQDLKVESMVDLEQIVMVVPIEKENKKISRGAVKNILHCDPLQVLVVPIHCVE